MSKTLNRLLLATTAAAFLGAAPAMAHRMRDGGDPAERHQRMEQRLGEQQQQLRQALQITPQQEAAWNRYTEAFKRPDSRPTPPDREAMARLTTPQRLDQMLARKTERDAHMNRIVEATRALYASLTPEQQKVFDAKAMAGRPMGPQGEGHGPHRHGKS